MRRLLVGVFAAVLAGCGVGTSQPPVRSLSAPAASRASSADWPMFGLTPKRGNASARATGITPANAHALRRRTLSLPGTVDSSPIFLRGVKVKGTVRDVIVVSTTYGRTVALSATTGRRLWTFTPRDIGRWQGSYRLMTASPVADPGRGAVYAASPDGHIHKLALATGREVAKGAWPVSITRLPQREKIAAALGVAGNYVVAATGGYVGDAPPYQGHVVAIDRSTGRIHAVFNSLCSNRRFVQRPSTCRASDSAIWGRAGVVVDTRAKEAYVATGNAPFDGRTNWGDSMIVLSFPGLRLKRNWTPFNQSALNDEDMDLGSVSPVLLPGGSILQGGKDARMDVLSRTRPNGHTTRPSSRVGGQRQTLPLPGGAQVIVSAPAGWGSYVFAATSSGTTAYRVSKGRLRRVWSHAAAGTSPVLAGGLLYVYDPGGKLDVYGPRSGRRFASLPAAAGHWNSPIVADGRVWVPEGDGNDHASSGTMSVYSLP